MAEQPPRWGIAYMGVTIRLEPQGKRWFPQWQRLTARWTDFTVHTTTLSFSSQEEAFAFVNTLLDRWLANSKLTWQAIRTQICAEYVARQQELTDATAPVQS